MRRLALLCLTAAAVFASPSAASAATITVDSTASALTPGVCTLRAAIVAANTDAPSGTCTAGAGADRIEFSLPAGSTIALSGELPEIGGNLEIAGPGVSQLAISGSGTVRPLKVGGPNNRISGLTIEDGNSNEGGGLTVAAAGQLELAGVLITENKAAAANGVNAFASGGGIFNRGVLTVVESTILDNVVEASSASNQNSASGAGIYNSSAARLVLDRSSIVENLALGAASGGAGSSTNANGAGIQNFAQLTVTASTISGNVSKGTGGLSFNSASGGGIANANAPEVKILIERSTVSGNKAEVSGNGSSSGGGLTIYGSSALISSSTIASNLAGNGANLQNSLVGAQARSTIIAKPVGGGSSCGSTALTSLGFNLEETTGCLTPVATDLQNVDPLLGPLLSNGGPTPTRALLKGSPAIDRGVSPAGETGDQRGRRRPLDIAQLPNAAGGNGADIGAFEYQIPIAEITGGPGEGGRTGDPEPSFAFRADDLGTTFVCSLDGGAPAPCASPFKAPRLIDGPHVFKVTAIAADGYFSAVPTIRSFTIDTRVTPPVEPPKPPVLPPVVVPRSTIIGLPSKTSKRVLIVRFGSSVPGSTFSCKLDKAGWRPCRSPFKTPHLKVGRHVFRLRATGPTGVADPTPAVKKFRVVAARRRG